MHFTNKCYYLKSFKYINNIPIMDDSNSFGLKTNVSVN